MSDKAALILIYSALGIGLALILLALLLRWAFSGNWYSVAGTEIERDIREAAERERIQP